MTKTKKIVIWTLALALVLVLAAGGLRTLARRRLAPAQAGDLMTVTAIRGNLEVLVSGSGTLEPVLKEEVRTRISGKIISSILTDGREVTAGDVLVELEYQDLTLQIERARLDVEIQEADLARLREEQTFATATAPLAGELTWRVSNGDRVQEGAHIATIQARSHMEVTGGFNATQVAGITAGQRADFLLLDFLVTLPGTVVSVSNVPRPGGSGAVLYDVVVRIDNPGGLEPKARGQLSVGDHRAVTDPVVALPEPVQVKAPVTGRITLLAEGNRMVRAAETLAEVSDPDRARQLANQIASAELKLKQARLDLEDRINQQRDRMGNSKIVSPLNGVITLPAQARGTGDDVNSGTLLATVTALDRLQVVIPVDELDIAKVRPGQPVTITAEALPGRAITGEVRSIAGLGRSQGGVSTFDVTVDVAPVEGLLAGMSANASILAESRRGAILVPIEAIQMQGGRSFVLVAESDGQNTPVPVETGAYNSTFMEIVSGLSEGQRVVIAGASGSSNIMGRFMQGNGFPGGVNPGMGQRPTGSTRQGGSQQ